VSLGGLDQCACKRGFFTLRDCGNPATTTCQICSRRVCDQHLAPRIDAKVCVECAARQAEEGAVTPGQAPGQSVPGQPVPGQSVPGQAVPGQGVPGEAIPGQAAPGIAPGSGPPLERLDPTSAAVRWRSRYYRSYGYSPMWWGTYDPYWDDYGYRWYDDDDDDDGGGFGDS
jgi:hypothetical protein